MNENISLSESFVRGEAATRVWGVFAKGASVGSAFLILSSLTPYQYGVWYLFLSFYEIFSQTLDLGAGAIKNDIMRFIGTKDFGRAKKLFFEHQSVRMLIGAVLWAAFFFGAPFLEARYKADFIFLIRISSFLFLLEFISSAMQALLTTQFRFGASARVFAYAKVVQFLALLGFYLSLYIGIKEAVIALLVSQVVAIIFILPTVIHEWRPWKERQAAGDWLIFKILSGHGKWDISRLFVSGITSRLQPFVIKLFLNTEAVGIYGVAKSMVELVISFLSSNTLDSLVPRLISEPDKARRVFVFGTKYMVMVSIGAIAAGIFGAFVLFNLFFENYLAALPYFYFLALILPMLVAGQIIDVFLIIWRKQKFTFMRSVTRGILWIGLLVILLPVAGLWGGIAAELFAVLLSVVWSYVYLIKLEPSFRPKAKELFSFGASDKEIRDIIFRNFLRIIRLDKR